MRCDETKADSVNWESTNAGESFATRQAKKSRNRIAQDVEAQNRRSVLEPYLREAVRMGIPKSREITGPIRAPESPDREGPAPIVIARGDRLLEHMAHSRPESARRT